MTSELIKLKSKFQVNDKVIIKTSGETVTITKSSYITNMKRYSYTVKEYPSTFYFEDEIKPSN
ncbi:hypothetical protein MJG50_13295 [Fredinandcohnia sp. SECRCQ15]|uniref:Uncharacterized protein n=1 Tax=Fredinandcohnia quinoae TaxID=2918902 RepID=A0AAW5E1U1_9BACI|nr:hypothetical protein [Fredinandcohnia sp. SECRCQ15]MCH1626308.1 hypothetical protein [Fredinandcohnia sp. SECRCQ15]